MLTDMTLKIEFVADKATKEPFDPSRGVGVGVQDLAQTSKYTFSLYAGGGTVDGRRGDHVLLAPMYTVTAEEIEEIARRTVDVITEYFSSMR